MFVLSVFAPPTQIVEIQRTLLALELLCCEDCFQPTLSHYLIKTQRTATGITKQKIQVGIKARAETFSRNKSISEYLDIPTQNFSIELMISDVYQA